MSLPSKISAHLLRFSLYAILPGGLLLFTLLLLNAGVAVALLWAVLPFVFFLVFSSLKHPQTTLYGVFIATYFIMGVTRYVNIPGGIVLDILVFFTFSIVLLQSLLGTITWEYAKNPLTVLSFIWLVYCFFLFLHPDTTLASWSAGIRGLAVYLFMFPLLVSLLFKDYKYLKIFIYVWTVLTLLAIIKALAQKYFGFDTAEKIWLYAEGGARTHIIYTGIRYFSFFTDAASFGSSMGLSMVVFSICSIYTKNKYLRFYLLFVAIAAGYGLVISGTRAAVAIPFAGYIVYFVLSKQWKIIVPGFILLVSIFIFFNYTHIGNSNINIFRMRSAFKVGQDASFKVRQENQKKMWTFMKDKPLGIGIGKAKRAEPGDYMYQLPTDTSLVYVWVETGIIGLVLFLFIFAFVLIKGTYDVLFKIKNKQLQGFISALIAGIAGMLVCSYGNEMLQQLPNGPIIYALMAFVILGVKFDKQLTENETN